jgi:hypothetical protein
MIGVVPIPPILFMLLGLYDNRYLTFFNHHRLRAQTEPLNEAKALFFLSTNMARSKPNKLKSPHKQQIEEQNNTYKTETTPHITPKTSRTNKKATGIKERSIKSSTTREKYIRNPENIPYYDGETNV